MNCLKKVIALFLLASTVPLVGFSQENKSQEKTATVQPTVVKLNPPFEFGILEDTPVRIKLTRTISSKDAKVGDKVDFEVIEDIRIKDVLVVKQGAMAIATVTKAQPKRRLGRSGKLDINIDYVQLADGGKVPLRATKGGSGGTRTTAMTGAMVAAGILFFPAAPLFLFMKGKNITIPQGTEVTAYVAADTPLEMAKFTNPEASSLAAVSSASENAPSAVAIKSSPDGAEITIDEKFVGNTPSTIQLAAGEHKIVVTKSGYKPWQKVMTVNPNGTVNLDVNLEKNP